VCLIKKILVALDGSKASKNALDFALEVVESTSEFHILTVVPPVIIPSYSAHILKSEAITACTKQMELAYREVLSKALRDIHEKNPVLKVYTHFKKGTPDEKIVETAKIGKFDLIIMGSGGIKSRTRTLGSVSLKVIDGAPCPVLIVK
jgi:nucleotide-binding universal stress UspA family protein